MMGDDYLDTLASANNLADVSAVDLMECALRDETFRLSS
jgi:hypothetical protein